LSEPNIEERTLDLRELLQIVRKRHKLILSVFLAAVGAAVIISLILPKVYQAETTLRVKQAKGLGESLLSGVSSGNPLQTKQLMSTYAEIMKSRTVLQAVIRKVYAGKPVDETPKYEKFEKRITTTPVRDTEILKVAVQAGAPGEARLLANTLVATFLERLTYLVRSEQKVVREFIGGRLRDAKLELERAEDLLEAYKRQQKIVAPDEESRALVGRMADLYKLVAENEVETATTQARLDNIQAQLAKEKVGFVAENKLIEQYKGTLAEQEVKLAGFLQKYTERYPEVQALRAEIAVTRERLREEINRVVNAEAASLNPIHQELVKGKLETAATLAAALAQKTELARIIAADEQILLTMPAKQQGLVRLTRDATVAQEIYIMLAKRHEEARISEVMQPTDVQVIDTAVAPEKPIKPQKRLNVLIAAFLGLFAGTGLAFALEYFNKTINNAEDVKTYLDLPVLGSIPDFGTDGRQPQNFWERKARGVRHEARGRKNE
jgi:succinoglycan biosynthesis transport protein ExoP